MKVAVLIAVLVGVVSSQTTTHEVRLLRVQDNSFIVATPDGESEVPRSKIKAARVHNGRSELRLINDHVIVLVNKPGSPDTDWKDLPREQPRPARKSPVVRRIQPKQAASLEDGKSFLRELKAIIEKARAGITTRREAGDVRAAEFLIQDIVDAMRKDRLKSRLLKESTVTRRVRILARNADKNIAARKEEVDKRNLQMDDLRSEIRRLESLQSRTSGRSSRRYAKEIRSAKRRLSEIKREADNEENHHQQLLKESRL